MIKLILDKLNSFDQDLSLTKNSSWLMIDKFLRLGGGFLVGMVIARYMGPAEYGRYNYAIAFVSLFSPLILLGLDSIVIREIVEKPHKRDEVLGAALGLRLIGSGLVVVAISALLLFTESDPITKTMIITLSLVGPFQALDIFDLWFQSQTKAKFSVRAKTTAFILALAFRLYLVFTQASTETFILSFFIEWGVGGLLLLFFYKNTGERLSQLQFKLSQIKNLLLESWPLICSSIIVLVYMRTDQIMLKNMLGLEANGYYSVAIKIIEALFVFPLIINPSILPKALKMEKAELSAFVIKYARFLIISALVISGTVVLLSKPLISFFYGDKYLPVIPIINILVFNCVFVFFSYARNILNLKYSLFKFDTLYLLLSAVLNIGLNFVLIHKMGVNGCIVASLSAQAFGNVIFPLLHSKTREQGMAFFRTFLF